eukprot:TCONS_00002123-protein
MSSAFWLISLLVAMATMVNGASPLDNLAKSMHDAKTYEEFEAIFKTVKWQTDIFGNEDFQKGLIKAGFNKNYVKVLAGVDIVPLVDTKKMYATLKQSKNATSDVMFMTFFQNIDVMKAMENLDWQSLLASGGISDDTVFVPGLPKGLTIDCGVKIMKLFGVLLQGNMSLSNPASLVAILSSPVGKVLDSWAKIPSGLLNGNTRWYGAYDECSAIPDVKYCSVGMKVVSQNGVYGTCMPKECTENDVASVYSAIISKQLGGAIQFTDDEKYVWCDGEDFSYSTGFIITLTIFCILGLLMVLGTFIEITEQNYESKIEKSNVTILTNGNANHENKVEMKNLESNDQQDESPLQKRTVPDLMKFLLCFSLLRNTRAIISTQAPKGAIESINGVRVISMWWIILGHFLGFLLPYSDNTLTAAGTIMKRWTSQAILNAFPSVDTFFLLSGLLVAYIALRRMDKDNGKINYGMYVLHRFIRLTPPYMLAILFWNNIVPYCTSGPNAKAIRERGDGGACNKYWWTNLLYINNFHPKKMDGECFGWAWYLANDMQFYLIAPAFLYAFYRLERRFANTRYRHFGAFIVTAVCCIISVIIRIIFFEVNEYPALITKGQVPGQPYPIKDRQDQLYIKPYTRIPPYLVGLFLGYILSRKIRITFRKTLIYTLGWLMAIGLGYGVVYGPYEAAFKDPLKFFSKTENVVYGSFSAFAWSLAVAWVIYACETNNAGLIKNFLSWKFWIPLSRLTFGAYLMHPIVLLWYGGMHEQGYHFQTTMIAFDFVSNVFFSYACAFILAVTMEIPVLNLEKLIF